MSKIEIEDNLRYGWEEFKGEYRGTWFDSIPSFPAMPESAKIRREAFELAKKVCEPRDLWKQNEVDEIAYMFKQLLQHIDSKAKPQPHQHKE